MAEYSPELLFLYNKNEVNMNSIKKIIEKENVKQKKNPGKANKEKRKEANKAKRGDPIPVNRIVTTKKSKAKQRQNIKKNTRKEIQDN